ncbi:LPD29 domain-containing protein [Nocardia sp. NPDC055029]
MATTRVLPAAAVARRVRAELARTWPRSRFVVRPGRGEWHNWVTVRWADGPPVAAVEKVTRPFGSLADGHDAAGPVVFGVHGVLTAREVTAAGYDAVADAIGHRYWFAVPRTDTDAIDWNAAYPITVRTPIVLGPAAGALAGTYGTDQPARIPLSRALALVADTAELPATRPRYTPAAAAPSVPARLLAAARRALTPARAPELAHDAGARR